MTVSFVKEGFVLQYYIVPRYGKFSGPLTASIKSVALGDLVVLTTVKFVRLNNSYRLLMTIVL